MGSQPMDNVHLSEMGTLKQVNFTQQSHQFYFKNDGAQTRE